MGILSKEVLIPGEVPPFKSWLGDFEKGSRRLSSAIGPCDREAEVGIRDTSICFGAIDWGVDLKTSKL